MNQPSEFPPPYAKSQAYQWVGKDGGFKVGTIAKDVDNLMVIRGGGRGSSAPVYLMKHSHTGELEWVSWDRLTEYPLSPIPEPEK